jgi:hypothetical protein
VLVDPACQNEQQYLPGLQSGFHANSGCMFLENDNIRDLQSGINYHGYRFFQLILTLSSIAICSWAEFIGHTGYRSVCLICRAPGDGQRLEKADVGENRAAQAPDLP